MATSDAFDKTVRSTVYLETFVRCKILLLANEIKEPPKMTCGPGSVVDIATGYGLDGPGIESLWG